HAWTGWTRNVQREFTNLPYREFTLRLQARDDTGRESAESRLAFRIVPPWWLSGWAYAGCGALGFLAVTRIVRHRTRALQRKADQLEGIVATRTEELRVQNQELARLHRLELDEKISARLAAEKARLEVLRYQLNPHFLFNALNSVCAQITRSPTAARAMVVRLADFCRLTLHRPDATEAAMSVADELALLRVYLEIEQARLGELLAVEISADPAAAGFRLPPFLLLPLVENAVKYGARTSVDRLSVRLLVRCEPAGVIAVEVANTGIWLEPGSHSAPSHGIGLENLRQRLTRYFPSAHEFTTLAADGWVIMRLRLLAPLRE
ncbi:MAG: histidine kinase, partial [Verrucomicrobia bacterium]|nr:histidine kinase [Verrucomicrobiota bacterium]